MSGIRASVSPNPLSLFLSTKPKPKISTHSSAVIRCFTNPSNLKLKATKFFGSNGFPSPRFHALCARPGGSSSSGESDSRTVLDAFFLGKAVAEALTERIESTIGEVLSGIGRLQAEQQKQILDFQEEVIDRAKKAKEKAARDAVEVQGPISSSIISPSYAVTSSPNTKVEIEVEVASNKQPPKPEIDSNPAVTSDEE